MLLYIMLYIMLAYLMQKNLDIVKCDFNSLSVLCYYLITWIDVMLFVCIMLFSLQMLVVFMFCLGLFTHSLFISSMILHHAQCF